ncbi:MAG TPA: methyl-accepting chemotaxis protein [Dongiaceae bacterium]|nr:methyl-accepting chemotaxis protein [Dongiaceae bacterium]
MKAYQNLKTVYKLSLVFALLTIVVIAMMTVSYRGLAELKESQNLLYEEKFKLLTLIKDLRTEIETSRARLQLVLLAKNEGDTETFKTEMVRVSGVNRQRINDLTRQTSSDAVVNDATQQLARIWHDYDNTRTIETVDLIEKQRYQEAIDLSLGIQAKRVEQIRDLSDRITKLVEDQTKATLERNASLVEQQRSNLIAFIALVPALTAVIIWITTRSIATPLANLTQWADQIAGGDLVSERQVEWRRDEVGLLSMAFSRMSVYLRDLAKKSEIIAQGDLTLDVQPLSDRDVLGNAFASMLGKMRSMMVELNDSVAVLTTSSQEILATTGQVASSAQETATAVAEITTTVEEVKQTATVASQKARQVGDAAQRTMQISQDGRVSVDSTLEGMSQVREQMLSVGESIVRLSEQSQAIGDVVATVNDLAEQSNLLGVNASIEAAKSGELGRGFAVVAQEVKQLADQSKQATAQVRAILNDIQKAMNRVVLAAEETGKSVDSGYRQAQSSGVAIRSLAETLEESSSAALQIAASSQQQLVGMDQVAGAMESIKQASQDNVAGTRQAEQAARNLHQLGQRLKDRISQFRD